MPLYAIKITKKSTYEDIVEADKIEQAITMRLNQIISEIDNEDLYTLDMEAEEIDRDKEVAITFNDTQAEYQLFSSIQIDENPVIHETAGWNIGREDEQHFIIEFDGQTFLVMEE
tara:strand:+ start:260 stop:604 length:345 start_codon:yes stop_codon:yes gene_type:complete